jgi:hypothetical protein
VAGFCEHGDEHSGSVRKRDIFDELSNNQLFKYPAPWSKYFVVTQPETFGYTLLIYLSPTGKNVDYGCLKIGS